MEENKLFIKLNIQRFATHLVSWDSYYLFSGGSSATVDGDAKGEIRVYLESQNTANNTSYIRLDHYIYTKNMQYGWSAIVSATSKYRVTGPNGSTSYQTKSKSDIGYPTDGYIFLGSTYHTISHNDVGGGTFTVNGTINVVWGTGTSRTRTTDFYVTIPTIPRYTSITTFTRTNITLDSFRVNWASANTVDRVEYRINSGSWTLGQSGDRTSGNFTVTGRSPNTTYKIQIRVRRKDSQLWTESANPTVTTLNIAKFVNVPNNIDIEKPFTITISRNGASDVSIGIFDTAGAVDFAPYRLVSGSSYTFELTESEKTALFNDMSTVNGKTYRVYLNTNSNAYRTSSDRTFNVVNANPIFNNFEYEDINPLTLDLTGDNQTIIKGFSNLKATITSANKMEAIKGANPKEYQLVVGSKQIKKDYHETNDVDLTLDAIENNVFIVYAIDSRGNSTQKQISPAEYIEYFKPTIGELTVSRENNISTFVNLSFTGTFFNANFGAEINEITAKYQYRNTKSDEWIIGDTELTLDISDNNFSFNNSIAGDLDAEGFSISESFEIKIMVEDLLSTNEKSEILVSATPNLSMHQEGTAINNQYDDSLGRGVQLNGENIYYNGTLLVGWSDE